VTAAVTFQLGTLSPQDMSHLSVDYVQVPVSAWQAGTSYNPTPDTVQWAFMPQATQVPGSSDWVAGSWDSVPTSLIYPYTAKCLLGTAGTTALTLGAYYAYVKITDNPEVPVLTAGILQIT
jgi:hypothetical protein